MLLETEGRACGKAGFHTEVRGEARVEQLWGFTELARRGDAGAEGLG